MYEDNTVMQTRRKRMPLRDPNEIAAAARGEDYLPTSYEQLVAEQGETSADAEFDVGPAAPPMPKWRVSRAGWPHAIIAALDVNEARAVYNDGCIGEPPRPELVHVELYDGPEQPEPRPQPYTGGSHKPARRRPLQ